MDANAQQPAPDQPYPQGPPGTPPSPSDKYFQDLPYSRAKNAFWLGFFGVTCFGVILGIPAIWVGFRALRDIDASNGRLRGRRFARIGIAFGCLSLLTSAGWGYGVYHG